MAADGGVNSLARYNTPCSLCGQCSPECCRSMRASNGFILRLLSVAFEWGVEVPCGFRSRLDILCPGNFMVVRGRREESDAPQFNITSMHHIWIDRTDKRTLMCGPEWRSLCQAYQLVRDDTLLFDYDKDLKVFKLGVIAYDGEKKQIVQFPGVWDTPKVVRDELMRTYFSDAMEVTMTQMNAINFELQLFVNRGGNESADNEYIFYVHKLDGDDLYKLEIPYKAYGSGYKISKTGRAMLGFGEMVVEGTFKHKYHEHIVIDNNWDEFRSIARLRAGSTMLVKVGFSIGWISLDVKKINCVDE